MAVANDDATEKSTFRCLDAARWVVAAAVMVVIVAVIAYAFHVVFRPGKLYLSIVRGYVTVEPASRNATSLHSSNLTFEYTVRAINPSGRIRIYYTDITARLKARNSTMDDNSFLTLNVPPLALVPNSQMDTNLKRQTTARQPFQVEYFDKLANRSSIQQAWILLNGTQIVEYNSGHNETLGVTSTLYYCWPIVVGSSDDGTAGVADAPCTTDKPTGVPAAV